MCNLAISIQRKPGNKEARKLIQGQYSKVSTQEDGIATLTFNAGKVATDRKLAKADYSDTFHKAVDAMKLSKLVAIHTRIASVGNVSDENVHFFEHNGRYFAHNGHVNKYIWRGKEEKWDKTTKADAERYYGADRNRHYALSAKQFKKAMKHTNSSVQVYVERDTVEERLSRLTSSVDDCKACGYGNACRDHEQTAGEVIILEALIATGSVGNVNMIPNALDTEGMKIGPATPANSEPSDSLLFLQGLPEVLDIQALDKYAEDKEFSGVALLVDEKQRKAWIMATRQCEIHTDGDYLNIYSFVPQKTYAEWQYVMGFPVVSSEEKKYDTGTLYPGTYEINLDSLEEGKDDILEQCL